MNANYTFRKVIGCGINQNMSEAHIAEFKKNLDSSKFGTKDTDTTLEVFELAIFSWDFEDVFPEAPVKYINFSAMDSAEWCESLSIPQARREAKRIAKTKGMKFIEDTTPDTGKAFNAANLEYVRSQR